MRPAAMAAIAAVMLVVGVAAALGVAGGGGAGEETRRAAPVRVGVGAPMALGSAAIWAPVLHTTQAIAEPRRGAPVVARVSARTPEGAPNLVVVTDSVAGEDGDGVWVRVRLAGSGADTGWMSRDTLGAYRVVEAQIEIDLAQRSLTLTRRGRVAFRAPVGVGTAAAPTPTGQFYVRSELTRFRSSFFGPLLIGISARAPGRTDWPVPGFVGIQGTDRPDLVPGVVSQGCIRLRNDDLVRLARLVSRGTPVLIR